MLEIDTSKAESCSPLPLVAPSAAQLATENLRNEVLDYQFSQRKSGGPSEATRAFQLEVQAALFFCQPLPSLLSAGPKNAN